MYFILQEMDVLIVLLLLLSTIIFRTIYAGRTKLSDSVLDIIDTSNVERILAERRLNESRQSKRFLIQNQVRSEQQQLRHLSHREQPEFIDFNFNQRHQNIPFHENVVSYNDTVPSYNTDNILTDLQAFRSDKLLKSGKNALYITRKEYLKKDWCKTEPLLQKIKEEGCLARTIINRFCYGQCNSFYIPKGLRRRKNGHSKFKTNGDFEDEDLTRDMFKSCAFCKPKSYTWITITLRCPSMVPQIRKKRVQRIKQCKCIAEPAN